MSVVDCVVNDICAAVWRPMPMGLAAGFQGVGPLWLVGVWVVCVHCLYVSEMVESLTRP